MIARGYLMGSAGDLLLRAQTVSGGIRSVSIPLPEAFVKPKIYVNSQLSGHVQWYETYGFATTTASRRNDLVDSPPEKQLHAGLSKPNTG